MKYWFEIEDEKCFVLPSIEKQLGVKFTPFKTSCKKTTRGFGFRRSFGPRGSGFGHMVYRILMSEGRVEVSYSHRCAESVVFRDECGAHWDNSRGVWWTPASASVISWLESHGYKKVEA